MSVIENDCVRGFKLHEVEVRLLAYADDIAVFCTDSDSITQAVKCVKRFCAVSGSAVNWGKCLGFWHGDWPEAPDTFANMSFVTTPVKYLGAPLQCYKDSESYWRSEVDNLRDKVNKWNGWNWSMFSRATICNIFLVSKLWYILQVLHCSRVNIQKIHRVFAVFVWASSWERSSRTNLFLRVRNGGLGLSHLFLRQVVNRFSFFRDVKNPFLYTVCQLRLGRHLPNMVVSTGSLPGGVYGFLREVVVSCRFLSARFSLEYLSEVNRKKLYKDLCDVVLPVPLYRSLYGAGHGHNVLKRVKAMLIPSGVKTFFFKLHTGTLTVKPWMAERGFFVPWGTHCIICRKEETIEHVFLDCWDAVFLWDVLQRTIKKEFPLDAYGIRYLPIESDDGTPFDMVMLMALHSIWKCRMAVRHADLDARAARQYFKESIRDFVEEQKLLECIPEWLPRVELLLTMRQF